jgi:hypothetical protein
VQANDLLGNEVRVAEGAVDAAGQDAAIGRIVSTTPANPFGVGPQLGIAGVQRRQVVHRAPVGVLDTMLDVLVGLTGGGSADDAHRRPYLDGSAGLSGAPFRFRNSVDAVFRARTPSMQISGEREGAARGRCAGIHHDRRCQRTVSATLQPGSGRCRA